MRDSFVREKKKKGGNGMNKKKKKLLVIALLLIFGLTLGYVANTYAKYTAQLNGSGDVSVAKWAFSEDNQNVDIVIDLDGNVDASTLVDGKIAPGTSGSFDIVLSNTHSEVGVDFSVTLTPTNAPTNLSFSTGNTITGKIAAGEQNHTDNACSSKIFQVFPLYPKHRSVFHSEHRCQQHHTAEVPHGYNTGGREARCHQRTVP